MLAGTETLDGLIDFLGREIDKRNAAGAAFFPDESPRVAQAASEMAARFLRGGRLVTFGERAYATDAQHVAVEFVHPVLVGKRALPALDVSIAYEDWIAAIAGPDDMAIGFAPPAGEASIDRALAVAHRAGAMTIALPGTHADYAVRSPHSDEHVHQELFELLTHALYETVHVFLEHRSFGEPQSASDFLYPFLGSHANSPDDLQADAAVSVLAKADDTARLREQLRREELPVIAGAIRSIQTALDAGGKLLLFGNGGSATDANDWALDCVLDDGHRAPIPAISLAMEPACITAIANDIGTEAIFLRQLIAQSRPEDVAIALSTSGGSNNVRAALVEARKRGMVTIALLGYDGGQIVREGLTDHAIVVRSDNIPRIQEVQATIYHVIRRALNAPARNA